MQLNHEVGGAPSLPLEESFFPGESTADPDQALSFAPPSPVTGDGSKDSLPGLDPRYAAEFDGLMYLGYLADTFVWCGHRFTIRTLTTGELMEVALVQRMYRDSMADSRAYTNAMVAASIVHVDGRPLPAPISRDMADTPLMARFRYVCDKWYPWTVDQIYTRYLALEAKVSAVLVAMGEVTG